MADTPPTTDAGAGQASSPAGEAAGPSDAGPSDAGTVTDSGPVDEDLLAAVQTVVATLDGAYALAVVHRAQPDVIVGARQGSPLVVGVGGIPVATDHFLVFLSLYSKELSPDAGGQVGERLARLLEQGNELVDLVFPQVEQKQLGQLALRLV